MGESINLSIEKNNNKRKDDMEKLQYSKNIVLMFPGQGSQYVGMLKNFIINDRKYLRYFKTAEEIFNEKFLDIISGNADNTDNLKLNDTRYAQISIYTLSCVLNDYLSNEIGLSQNSIKYVIGHSLGDYSALYSCGAYGFETGAEIVSYRSKIMSQQSLKNENLNQMGAQMGMAAVIGSDYKTIESVLKNYEGKVFIANYNEYNQIVLSGFKSELLEAIEKIKNIKAKKTIILNVNVASHCPLMRDAAQKLNVFFETKNIKFNKLKYDFFSSTCLKKIDNYQIKDMLVEQLVSPVKWVKSIECIINEVNELNAVKAFIEVGPGKVLSGLVKRILDFNNKKDILIFNTDSLEEIEKIKEINFISKKY